jgi:hypothetical protein
MTLKFDTTYPCTYLKIVHNRSRSTGFLTGIKDVVTFYLLKGDPIRSLLISFKRSFIINKLTNIVLAVALGARRKTLFACQERKPGEAQLLSPSRSKFGNDMISFKY